MKKIAVLSTNENQDYAFYIPIVEWAWNRLGWEIALFVTSECKDITVNSDTTKVYQIPDIDNVRSGTLAQVVRHFASNVLPKDAYIMVQDIDLIPVKEWNPDLDKRTIWGWELTGRSFIPVHYTGMTGDKWYDLMDCSGDLKSDMEREMKANGRAYSSTWGDSESGKGYWDADWDILTQKVLAKKDLFTFITRGMVQLGQYETPKGRIDRCSIEVHKDGSYHWGYTENQTDVIDIHCENHNPSSPDKWKMIRGSLVKHIGEIPEWMDEYVLNHFKKYGR